MASLLLVSMNMTLRSAQPTDEEFLFELYASTRAEEMAAWGWDSAQQDAFLRQQHSIRESQYRSMYADTDHQIILNNDIPVGRILTGDGEGVICLVDIALLPAGRGGGIGTRLVRDLQSRAAKSKKAVVLSVTKDNRAAHLYERLGFTVTDDNGLYLSMRWESSPS